MSQIPEVNKEDFVYRLLENFPADWSSDEARSSGGVLHSLFSSVGAELEYSLDQVQFIFDATRVRTATEEALDLVAKDFFGTDVRRSTGEGDTAFRQRILAQLLAPAVTIEAIKRAIEIFTGKPAVLFEPWNLSNGSFLDANVYLGISTPGYGGRLNDPGLRYQFFVEAKLPGYSSNNEYPVYAIDRYFSLDRPECPLFEVNNDWFLNTQKLDSLLNTVKPAGIIAWRRYGS